MFGIPHFLIFAVHIGSLFVAACGILYADKLGFSWFRSRTHVLPAHKIRITHEIMGAALSLMLASGLLLFWPVREYLVMQPLFYVKMAFVAGLIINSFIIDNLMHHATHTPFRALPAKTKRSLVISGVVSSLCWAGAALTALFLFGFFS